MSEEKTSLLGNKAEPKPFYFLDRTDRAKSIADKVVNYLSPIFAYEYE